MKLNISIVSYKNSIPFLYGLKHEFLDSELTIHAELPFQGVNRVHTRQVDLALLPVAAIPTLVDAEILNDWVIGCDGEVGSVGIVSNQPITELKTIYLDADSVTSNKLLEVLTKEHWVTSAHLVETDSNFDVSTLKVGEGALRIGDKALVERKSFEYFYDLGAAWKDHTGLPFIFATWVRLNNIDTETEKRIESALNYGVEHKLEAISQHFGEKNALYEDYVTDKIVYNLKENMQEAMDLFFEKAGLVILD